VALPFFMAGLRMQASFQLDIPRMFAALAMITASGLILFALTMGLEKLLLGQWHESSMKRET
jgi:NitT/TauT family transport system permease protein